MTPRTFILGCRSAACVSLSLLATVAAAAEAPPFDLAGPALQVSVTHAGATLPISEVPNLSAGDQLAIRADLPASQSVHYLLVAAFLRGSTNPPPTSWFYRAETWTKKGRDGLKITIPAEAQQVLVFLAPQTGGDFGTLVGAVRGRPGAFVRASQDLNQAGLDRSRLDAFLAAVRKGGFSDPDRLKTISPLLARSLAVKLNNDCLLKAPEVQATCLMQGQDSLVLNDGHSASIVDALTSGGAVDLAYQISATPGGGYGVSSPYIGAVLDIAHILESMRTAQYQYIPALSTLSDDRLSLLLNTPPSFHNPQSVLVAALPAVQASPSPPLTPVDPKAAFCAHREDLVLPVEGAPLAYSTRYAHDLKLRVKARDGQTYDLPVRADAERGGLITDTHALASADLGESFDATLQGVWGFQVFTGPVFHLQTPPPGAWRVSDDDQQALVAGREDVVHLEGAAAACVQSVTLQKRAGEDRPVTWKVEAPDRLVATLPMDGADPGRVTLQIKSYGRAEADALPLEVYNQASRLESFVFHAGDHAGLLKGGRLDQVVGLTFGGVAFTPGALASVGGDDTLPLTAADGSALDKLGVGQGVTARVALNDGRSVRLKTTVAPPRPQVDLIDKNVQATAEGGLAVRLTDPGQLPQGAQLTFSVRARGATRFDGRESIEVAGVDGGATTTLTLSNGLTQADAQVALATLDPGKAFGPSAFGPLRFRVVQNGGAGDWQPLATLVRLPTLRELKCTTPGQACELHGADLYLIEAMSSEPGFERAVKVPQGFAGRTLYAPHPSAGGVLYVRLHDDPDVINQITTSAAPSGNHGRRSPPA